MNIHLIEYQKEVCMSDKNKEKDLPNATKTATVLWDLVLLCMGSFTVKTIWNLTIKRLFPAVPYMYFLDGVGILVLVYVIARAASIGFMTEAIRAFSTVLETTSEALRDFAENNFKVNVHKNERKSNDDSELN